jgi:hypothetical protein
VLLAKMGRYAETVQHAQDCIAEVERELKMNL